LKVVEVIYARGHPNIRSTHKTTLQFTKEKTLTERGDCIVAVAATKSAKDLSPEFKRAAQHPKAKITIIIEADNIRETINAQGSPRLSFMHSTDLVVRKSGYVCGRTLAVQADKAAGDLSRKLVEKLRNPEQTVKITLIAGDLA
jgi:hypothetical protein